MGVDFSKISKKKQEVNPVARRQFQNPKVFDTVALKKSWARSPSYWVDLIFDEDTRTFAIRKRWDWFNKHANEHVKDEHIGGATYDVVVAADRFVAAVDTKLCQSYGIHSRVCDPASPALNHAFNEEDHVDEDAAKAQQEPEPEPDGLTRKGTYDLW